MIRLKNKEHKEIEDAVNKMQDLGKFIIKGDSKLTTLDLDNATLGDVANVLVTLIKALQKGGIIG